MISKDLSPVPECSCYWHCCYPTLNDIGKASLFFRTAKKEREQGKIRAYSIRLPQESKEPSRFQEKPRRERERRYETSSRHESPQFFFLPSNADY